MIGRNNLKNDSFLAGKAGSFSNVPLRTVQSWVEKGLLTPEIADTTGTGSKRLFSLWNCIEIGIIKSLADSRVSIKLIKEIMNFMRIKAFDISTSFQIPAHINTLLGIMFEPDRAVLLIGLGDKPDFRFVGSFEDPEQFKEDLDKILLGYDKTLILNINNICAKVISAMGMAIGREWIEKKRAMRGV